MHWNSGHPIDPAKLLVKEEQRRPRNRTRQAKYRRNRLSQKKVEPAAEPVVSVKPTPVHSIPAESCALTPEPANEYQAYQESLLAKAQQVVDDMSTDSEMDIEPLCPYCGHQGHQEPECPAKASRIEGTTTLYLAASSQSLVKTSALIKLADTI